MPLANAFLFSLEEAASEASYPLAVAACSTCGLVQLHYVVPAERMYRDYLYVTSTSDTAKAHAEWLATELVKRYAWQPGQLLVEVASNDGTVLKSFQRTGLRVLGIEPARNIAAMAEADGVSTVAEFFSAATAKQVAAAHGRAIGILARHVFAHVNDVHDFLEGVSVLLDDEGVFVIEMSYLGPMLSQLEFDSIYHEHLSYFSLAPLIRLCREHGLDLVDAEPITLHGGSMLFYVRRPGRGIIRSRRLEQLLEEEQRMALTSPQTLTRFGESVRRWRDDFTSWMGELQQGGARFIGYGAAAKANTLLNYCPAEVAASLGCLLDRSPLKHGRYAPGTHLPVKPVEHWRTSDATHLLILAWNYKEEIIRQLQPFARRGGRFVVPTPHPEIVDGLMPEPSTVRLGVS